MLTSICLYGRLEAQFRRHRVKMCLPETWRPLGLGMGQYIFSFDYRDTEAHESHQLNLLFNKLD